MCLVNAYNLNKSRLAILVAHLTHCVTYFPQMYLFECAVTNRDLQQGPKLIDWCCQLSLFEAWTCVFDTLDISSMPCTILTECSVCFDSWPDSSHDVFYFTRKNITNKSLCFKIWVVLLLESQSESILCLTSRTTVTSARACHHARNLCVFSRGQKGTPGLTHKGCVLQRVSLDALSDVTVVLGMRQSIVQNWYTTYAVIYYGFTIVRTQHVFPPLIYQYCNLCGSIDQNMDL